METITTDHLLRKITLRFDRGIVPPEFETVALQYYQEIHDRTYAIKERVQSARRLIPGFNFQIEELEELFREARKKFDHLQVMLPTNPVKEWVRNQLNELLIKITTLCDDFVPEMIETVEEYFGYEDFIFEHDQWMNEVAFPQFRKIIQFYEDCSVDMVVFDEDLDDFRGTLSFVKRLESKYYEEMDQLIELFGDLNYDLDGFFNKVEEFDSTLIP